MNENNEQDHDDSNESTPKCGRCGVNPAEPLHSCPYQADINDNCDSEYCDCCSDCEHECAMDI